MACRSAPGTRCPAASEHPSRQVTGHHELAHTRGPDDLICGPCVSDARRERLELFPYCVDRVDVTGKLMADNLPCECIGESPWIVVWS